MQVPRASGGSAAAFLRIAVLGSAVAGIQAQSQLPGHSIVAPPAITTLASDWFLAGTVIPSTRSLVLSPGVPNRLGYIWSKFPLLTNDFEVEFEFSIKAPAERSVKDDGFAFWYVQDNASDVLNNISVTHLHNQEEIIANSWSTAYTAETLDL